MSKKNKGINEDYYNKIVKQDPFYKYIYHNIFGHNVDSYLPFYDEYADYNTNAKSYYDYLARFNKLMSLYAYLINRLLRRNVDFIETDTLILDKVGDWVDNGDCPPENFDDIIKLLGNVKVSKKTQKDEFKKIDEIITRTIPNAIKVYKDGLYVRDYTETIHDLHDEDIKLWEETFKIWEEIARMWEKIKELERRIRDNEINIQGIKGLNTKELELGKDYVINFYNGFYSPSDDLVVKVGETTDHLDIIITTNSPVGQVLKHDGDLREETELSLTPSPDYPPKCDVFSLKFLGDYAKFNNKKIVVENTKPALWYIAPLSQRASWDTLLTAHSKNGEYYFNWRQFSDGLGDQLKHSYTEPLQLNWGNVEVNITIEK